MSAVFAPQGFYTSKPSEFRRASDNTPSPVAYAPCGYTHATAVPGVTPKPQPTYCFLAVDEGSLRRQDDCVIKGMHCSPLADAKLWPPAHQQSWSLFHLLASLLIDQGFTQEQAATWIGDAYKAKFAAARLEVLKWKEARDPKPFMSRPHLLHSTGQQGKVYSKADVLAHFAKRCETVKKPTDRQPPAAKPKDRSGSSHSNGGGRGGGGRGGANSRKRKGALDDRPGSRDRSRDRDRDRPRAHPGKRN